MTLTTKKNLYISLIILGITPFMINGYLNSIFYTTPIIYWGFEIFSWVFIPAIVITIAIKKGDLRLDQIGISCNIAGKKNLPLLIFACAILCPLDYWLYKGAHDFFSSLFPSTPYFEYESVIPDDKILSFIIAVYFALSAGIVEEYYFRGLMYKAAQFFSNPAMIYVLVSPILFALIHWEGGLANVSATYVSGLFSVIVFLIARNLWPLIIGHIYTDYIWYS